MDPCAFPTEDWREDKEDSTKNMPKVQLKSKENQEKTVTEAKGGQDFKKNMADCIKRS